MLSNLEKGSRIYIAGPMRHVNCFNYGRFFYWEERLKELGYRVINPARIDCCRMLFTDWKFTEDQYKDVLAMDLRIVEKHADAVFMLDGWWCSEGALREIECATTHEKKILFEAAREIDQ